MQCVFCFAPLHPRSSVLMDAVCGTYHIHVMTHKKKQHDIPAVGIYPPEA